MAYECEKSERAQVQAGVQAQAQVRLPAAQKRHEKMMKTGTKVMTMGTIQAAVGVRATTVEEWAAATARSQKFWM